MKILSLVVLTVCTFNLFAQDFLEGNNTFSSKKLSYLTLQDGSEVTGYIKDIDRKKGLIEEITIKDESGKERKFLPEQIHHMYIAPSNFDKFASGYTNMHDLTKLNDDKTLNAGHIKDGYALFEYSEVMIKKDKKSLLLQLLNPGYSTKIKVYFDPLASETASASIGGFKVAGGDAKSYYVKKGNEVAFKLMKKNYKEENDHLFGDCKDYLKKIGNKDGELTWSKFSESLYKYTYECN